MDLETAGAGASGGLLSAILMFFGIKQRFDRNEKDIENIQKGTVWRNTCSATHKGVDDRLTRIETKLDIVVDKLGGKNDHY